MERGADQRQVGQRLGEVPLPLPFVAVLLVPDVLIAVAIIRFVR